MHFTNRKIKQKSEPQLAFVLGKTSQKNFIIMSSEVRKTVNRQALEVSRVYAAKFQKSGTVTAEIKQTIKTQSFYKGMSVKNDMQDNIFALNDFSGAEEKMFESVETRVAWLNVPAGTTPEQVVAKLAQLPDARLYKTMSNKPILSSDQRAGISAGLTTLDAIANSQIVRFPVGSDRAGQICLDTNGKPQYRAVYFKTSAQEDVDERNSDPEDFYMSAEIKAEIGAVSYHTAAVEDTVM
jgi:hypothetical protein